MVRFGPAGQDEAYAAAHKTTLDMPDYLAERGLSAFEYQCGHGVRIAQASAAALGEKAAARGIALSVHAPYYISLASPEEEKRLNSVNYILQAARAAHWMGGTRVVVHPGSAGRQDRAAALALALGTMEAALQALADAGLGHIHICPETMGKVNQLGSVEEVLALCKLGEQLIPCIDFGHLYARSAGAFGGYDQMAALLDRLEAVLGSRRAKGFHAHFSKIEYTPKGGEKRHLTFADPGFGPDFAPLAKLIRERGLTPTIICESAGTQVEDALAMKQMVEQAL